MTVTLELDVVPYDGGNRIHFTRSVTWEATPRVGERIELGDGWSEWPVERVVFTARGNVRVQLELLRDDHHDFLHDLRTHDKSMWKEQTDD